MHVLHLYQVIPSLHNLLLGTSSLLLVSQAELYSITLNPDIACLVTL